MCLCTFALFFRRILILTPFRCQHLSCERYALLRLPNGALPLTSTHRGGGNMRSIVCSCGTHLLCLSSSRYLVQTMKLNMRFNHRADLCATDGNFACFACKEIQDHCQSKLMENRRSKRLLLYLSNCCPEVFRSFSSTQLEHILGVLYKGAYALAPLALKVNDSNEEVNVSIVKGTLPATTANFIPIDSFIE